MNRYVLLLIFLLPNMPAHAERVAVSTTIEKLHSFSEQVGYDGDITINVANPITGCEGGFWLRNATTAGYKNTVSVLLSAFHANAKVSISALNDEIWTGSSTKYCRMDQISLLK